MSLVTGRSATSHPEASINLTPPTLDWKSLEFGYIKTDYNIRYTFRDGQWDGGVLTGDESVSVHMAATCLHYGQQCFEGLKAFRTKHDEVVVFRPDENAARLKRSAQKLFMEAPPETLFMEAVDRVVKANQRFVPPYGTGASLYIRPLLVGLSPLIGVKAAREFLFMVLVTPVGPYFKQGFKPVELLVEEEFDRASPGGVGDAKCGGNYAAGLRGSHHARSQGFTEVLYLDAREKKWLDESGPANFFAITQADQYVTPQSPSILPSITNMSLVTLAEELGLRPQRRPVAVEEIPTFKEAGCCGTAAVITPVGAITWKGKKYVYSKDGQPGPWCTKLYDTLRGIQLGDLPDKHNWVRRVV